jgi:hypothetical protein
LLAASFVRGPLDFTTARAVVIVLLWIELTSAWLIFRHLFKTSVAGLVVLPLLAAHAFTDLWSFVAYCSEHVPNALLAVGCWSLLTAWEPSGRGPPRIARLFGAGLFLGAVPFGKLQAAPVAAVSVVGGIWFLISDDALKWTERRRSLMALIGGAATVPAIIVGTVLCFGIWPDFFHSYILDNIRYAGANRFPAERAFSWMDAPRMLIELSGSAENFNPFFWWMIGFGGCGLLLIAFFTKWHRRCVGLAAAASVAAICAALAPGRLYLHYLQLIIFPVGLFAGLVAGSVLQDVTRKSFAGISLGGMRAIILGLFLVCGLAPQIWWRALEPHRFIGRFSATHGALVRSEVSNEILRHASPGERLGMWGWMPVFWVETGLIQATRDANDSREIDPHPEREYYRSRFLGDLLRARPPVFVDAVGPGNFVYEDRAEFAHETFPALRDYLVNNYRLVRDVAGTRIYVRSDRL